MNSRVISFFFPSFVSPRANADRFGRQRPLQASLALISAVLLSCVAAQERKVDPSGFSVERLGQVDRLFAVDVESNKLSGAVTLVAKDGVVKHFGAVGWADVDRRKPMRRDSIFRIASMSKPITSAGVLTLVDAGKLSLDDAAAKFIPEFASMKVLAKNSAGEFVESALARPITIRDLLAHQSGLTYRIRSEPPYRKFYVDADVADGLAQCEFDLAENARRVAKTPLLHQPGEVWEYGISTDMLGRIVEVASGESFGAYLERSLFKPLAMADTCFFPPAEKLERVATFYGIKTKPTIEPISLDPIPERAGFVSAGYQIQGRRLYESGGAGLVSTASDYLRFTQMLLNEGELDGIRVMSKESVRRMTSPQVDRPIPDWGHGVRFGFGVGVWPDGVSGSMSPGSYSWGGMFMTHFWIDPKERLIGILMTQLWPAGDAKYRVEFPKRVYGALEARKP